MALHCSRVRYNRVERKPCNCVESRDDRSNGMPCSRAEHVRAARWHFFLSSMLLSCPLPSPAAITPHLAFALFQITALFRPPMFAL